jgi:hypothetical protein
MLTTEHRGLYEHETGRHAPGAFATSIKPGTRFYGAIPALHGWRTFIHK